MIPRMSVGKPHPPTALGLARATRGQAALLKSIVALALLAGAERAAADYVLETGLPCRGYVATATSTPNETHPARTIDFPIEEKFDGHSVRFELVGGDVRLV